MTALEGSMGSLPMFTTPNRPLDILAVLPELATYARRATRLHPRRGNPAAEASSVAGPLLWPEDEPWPTCSLPHLVTVRREATAEEQARSPRIRESPAAGLASVNAKFEEIRARFPTDPNVARLASRWYDGQSRIPAVAPERVPAPTIITTQELVPTEHPVPLVPVVQLRTADVPEIPFPEGTDLLQILWCPHLHTTLRGPQQHYYGPAPSIFWRTAARLAHTIAPGPAAGGVGGYVLEQCTVHPEHITEYPDPEDLPEPLQEQIYAWEESLGDESAFDYRNDLSLAPGLKTGGWPYWPETSRSVRCDCGSEMYLLLTLPNGERGADSWNPLEECSQTGEDYNEELDDPTRFSGAREGILIYICHRDPHHEPWIAIE
ncbi:hypothetical protein [Kitasatospora griseola]|uniref:hypothetical protein n=1 Tax=Kitasatospora griseola TaxID=2064 RepID=UPI00343F6940